MDDLTRLEALPGAENLIIDVPATRLEPAAHPHPSSPPPYTSLVADVFRQICLHKYKDKLRQIALHQVKLRAGQSALPAGGLGREVRRPVSPEMRGGRILCDDI